MSSSRQSSCSEMVRQMISLPRSIIGGVSKAMATRINGLTSSNTNTGRRDHIRQRSPPCTTQHDRPAILTNNVPEEWAFLESLERAHGFQHPFFYACRFIDALKMAEQDHKLLFVYLHNPEHPFTAPFCGTTLSSDLVVQFLDANFISWGSLASIGEGLQLAATLQVDTFPFCAVVAPAPGNSIAVLEKMIGPVSPSELVEILQRIVEEQGLVLGVSRSMEDEKQRADNQLREEQDAAYLASLQINKETDRVRELIVEEPVKRPSTEAHSKANKEKLIKPAPAAKQQGLSKVTEGINGNQQPRETMTTHRKDSQVTKGKDRVRELVIEEPVRRPSSEAHNKANKEKLIKPSFALKKGTSQVNEDTKETQQRKDTLTTHGKDSQVTKILIRLPNGETREQSFNSTDTIHSIYKYIDSLRLPSIVSYRLISGFPRRVYGHEHMRMTLKDVGLHPRASLFLELA